MTRRLWILAVVSVFGLMGAAAATGSAEEKIEAFRIRAEKDRAKLGLDRNAAKGKYPTPELSLRTTDGEPVRLRAGESAELRASATLVDGSLVVLPCEGVEVVSLQQTRDSVTAKVKVAATQLPISCDLTAISPVSFIQTRVTALEVIGSYAWDLKLSNGMTAKWTTRAVPGEEFSGEAEFFASGKSLGKRTVTLNGGGNQWHAEVPLTDDEANEQVSQMQQNGKNADLDGSMAKIQALSEKMSAECTQLPTNKMAPCFEKYQKQIDAASAGLNAAQESNEALSQLHPSACRELELEISGGKVTGTAKGCRTAGEQKVTGTVTASKK